MRSYKVAGPSVSCGKIQLDGSTTGTLPRVVKYQRVLQRKPSSAEQRSTDTLFKHTLTKNYSEIWLRYEINQFTQNYKILQICPNNPEHAYFHPAIFCILDFFSLKRRTRKQRLWSSQLLDCDAFSFSKDMLRGIKLQVLGFASILLFLKFRVPNSTGKWTPP